MSPPMFEIQNLAREYSGRTALEIENLALEHGTITGLSGPNGSGKSTFLRILALLEAPTRGRILINGRPATPADKNARREVSLLLQEPYLLKRSVFENVAYGLRVRGCKRELKNRVCEALTWVGLGPDAYAGRAWFELSGGEAQRVALASRLVLKPGALLLDEPTASLDEKSTEMIRTAALKAKDEWGATLVVASHDTDWMYETCDKVLNLHQGRIIGHGRVNVLPGPWLKKHFPELPPPDARGTAAIHPQDVSVTAVSSDKEPSREIRQGQVRKIVFNGAGDIVYLGIKIANQVIWAGIDGPAYRRLNPEPGQTLAVNIPPDSVRWIPAA